MASCLLLALVPCPCLRLSWRLALWQQTGLNHALRAPKYPGGQFCPLHEGPELGPGDLGVYLVGLRVGAKATIEPGDDVLAPLHVGVAYNALSHDLGMLHDVGRRIDG